MIWLRNPKYEKVKHLDLPNCFRIRKATGTPGYSVPAKTKTTFQLVYDRYKNQGDVIFDFEKNPKKIPSKAVKRMIANLRDVHQSDFNAWALRVGLQPVDLQHRKNRRSHQFRKPVMFMTNEEIEKLMVILDRELEGRARGEFD